MWYCAQLPFLLDLYLVDLNYRGLEMVNYPFRICVCYVANLPNINTPSRPIATITPFRDHQRPYLVLVPALFRIEKTIMLLETIE